MADPDEIGLTQRRSAHGVSTNVAVDAQFALIGEALPRARTIGLLYDSTSQRSTRLKQQAEAALPAGWRLEALAVDLHTSISEAIATLLARRVDVVWTAADSAVYDTAAIRSLLLDALRAEIPVFGFSPSFVRAGATIGIGIDPRTQARQVANLVAQLRSHAQEPARRPQPPAQVDPEFQIALNLIVAQRLRITLPDALVARADHVFRPEGQQP